MSDISIENNLILYVYYKVPVTQAGSCLLSVKKLNQFIKSRFPDLKIQHQKKTHLDAANNETWMEIYTDIPDMSLEIFTAFLSEAAEKNGFPQERKYEIFRVC